MSLRSALAALAVAAALLSGPATAAVYNLSFPVGAASVGGTITTDGTLGALGAGNITDYAVQVADAADSFTLTPGNSTLILSGTALTASLSGLVFDYGAAGASLFTVFDPAVDNAFCLQASSDCVGNPLVTAVIVVADTVYTASPSGRSPIGTPAAPVPAPAGWAVLALGLFGLAATRRGLA